MTLVFVYGSLKRGYRLHHLLQDQKFLGPASTITRYRLFDAGEYPGLVEVSTDNIGQGVSVRGELYRVDDECLRRLDEAEGVDEGLYYRRPICLNHLDAQNLAEAWFFAGSVADLADCGQEWPATEAGGRSFADSSGMF